MNWPRQPLGNSSFVSWCRKLLAAARASEIRPGVNYKVSRTPNGTILHIAPGGGSSAGDSITLTYCTFVSMGNDLITVRPSGGNVDGSDDIQIVKPYKLRFTITSQTIDGVVIDYSSYSTVNQRRVATVHGTATTEDQIIIPRYLVGDPVYYVSGVTTGVLNDSEEDVGKLEVNIDGRAWGKLYAA